MQEIEKSIIKNNIWLNIIWQNIFPYRPEEAILLDSESLLIKTKLSSVIREIKYKH